MSRYSSRISLSFFLIGLTFNVSSLLADPPATSQKVSQIPSAFSLKAEEVLLKQVSIQATDLPLRDLLKELSQHSGVSLLTMSKMEDQRVTLHLTDQPLYQIMTRLCGLLSHSPSAPRGYFWTKESQHNNPHPRYRLERDLRSLTEEREALNFPRQKAGTLLRDMRDLSRMSVDQRKLYKGDLTPDYLEDPDMQLYRTALAAASDSQIDTLIQSGSLPVNAALFRDEIARYNKTWHDLEAQRQQRIRQTGGKDPYPAGVPDMPPDAPTLTFHVNDYDGEHPERMAMFGLALNGVQTLEVQPGQLGISYITFSPLRKYQPPFPETTHPGEPIIDLTPLLTGPDVTPEQKGDVGFTLQVLAKASGISLYQEEFYKTVYWGSRSNGLKVLKGTVPQLLNAICAEWGYDAKKVGLDYMLWSTTWALDRTFDVPERLLVQWRERFQKQNGFTLNDRIEFASTLTWPQIFVTLQMLLPKAGPWNIRREAEILRFIGGFSASERRAMADQGLAITAMSPVQQAALLSEMRSRSSASHQTDTSLARLVLTQDPKWQSEGTKREFLEVKSDRGDTLWQTVVFYQVGTEKVDKSR